ncbi:dynein beta chain, ciliary-like [Patagioenas fasciata]|uniref:dynein beta chain, ciliary-like n=1 Tax=Patagioenas fasciata TaxID=372321 RepID=UPI003A99F00B
MADGFSREAGGPGRGDGDGDAVSLCLPGGRQSRWRGRFLLQPAAGAGSGPRDRASEPPRKKRGRRQHGQAIVPILTNKKNHQGWPQVVSQDIVRHVHNLKSTIFTVVGQVDGKTLLPLPAGSEGIEDIDLENEKSMERIDKSLVYAMESAIIDWSHQIQEALKKESSEPLLQGSNPNPKVELEFWKNRYPEQPGQCMVPCGAGFV